MLSCVTTVIPLQYHCNTTVLFRWFMFVHTAGPFKLKWALIDLFTILHQVSWGKSIRISGLKDVSHHIKKLDGFPIKLQMVTAVWENVSLNDLFLLSEASETCLKLSFDPVIDTMTTRLQFGNGKARFLRTMTRPTLMGLISAREVDSVLREPQVMPDGLVVGGGLGLQSPLLVDKIQQSDYLKAVASQPPSKGKVRAVDHTSTMTWCILSRMHHIIMENNCSGTDNGMKGTCVVVFLPRQLGVCFCLSRKVAPGTLEFYST